MTPEEPAMTAARATLVTGVDFVTLSSRDLTAAEAFYADILGLPRSAAYQRGGRRRSGSSSRPAA
jgi:catechol-2,3-dioxygenase